MWIFFNNQVTFFKVNFEQEIHNNSNDYPILFQPYNNDIKSERPILLGWIYVFFCAHQTAIFRIWSPRWNVSSDAQMPARPGSATNRFLSISWIGGSIEYDVIVQASKVAHRRRKLEFGVSILLNRPIDGRKVVNLNTCWKRI